MAQAGGDQNTYVKKGSMLIVAAVCLVVGFVGGIAFSIYRTAPTMHQPSQASRQQMPAPRQQPQEPTPEQTRLIIDLESKTMSDPRDLEAWTQLGNTYFDVSLYKKAIAAYEKSLALDPDNPDVWTDMGVMYRRDKQPDKAIESFDRAISVDPAHETARFNKGIVLMHDQNDIDGAIVAWEGLVELNPNAATPGGQSIKDMLDRVKAGQ